MVDRISSNDSQQGTLESDIAIMNQYLHEFSQTRFADRIRLDPTNMIIAAAIDEQTAILDRIALALERIASNS